MIKSQNMVVKFIFTYNDDNHLLQIEKHMNLGKNTD